MTWSLCYAAMTMGSVANSVGGFALMVFVTAD